MLSFLVCAMLSVSSASLAERFETWVEEFEMRFDNGEHRKNVFSKWLSNDRFIEMVNAGNRTYSLGHNHFSGMDVDDFREYLNRSGAMSGDVESSDEHVVGASSPDAVDWVSKGAVTPVKDQGQCGSCWSFSTTGALEGAYYIKYHDLVSFSEQQLVDCDTFSNGGRDHGCNGGLMDNAFNWIDKNGGLCTEQDYPYVSGTTMTSGSCSDTCELVDNSKVHSHVDVKPSDSSMMSALAQQPVSIAIQADQREFQLYKSGVFTEACGTNLDHGVLAVGYGSMNGEDYYRVKNSWSSTWGDKGYIYLGRGSQYNNGKGQCGMLMQASYPVL